jgi:hypothetical protein
MMMMKVIRETHFLSGSVCLLIATVTGVLQAQTAPTSTAAAPAASPPVGQTSGAPAAGSQVFFESQALAYSAMERLTAMIRQDVCSGTLPPGAHVVLFDTYSFQAIQQYRAFERSLGVLADMMHSFAPAATA